MTPKDKTYVRDDPKDHTRLTLCLFYYEGLWRVQKTLILNDLGDSRLLAYFDNDYNSFALAHAVYKHEISMKG